MANTPRTVPYQDGMALGLGFDDLLGIAGTIDAVTWDSIESVEGNEGMNASYETSLIYSYEQLFSSLGISVNAEGRYLLYNAEGKFKFAEETRFNSSSTFLVARADLQNSYKRIRGVKPVEDAEALVRDNDRETFRKRYGDMFIRGIRSGGEYIAVLSIISEMQQVQRELAVNLKAAFDMISASGELGLCPKCHRHSSRY